MAVNLTTTTVRILRSDEVISEVQCSERALNDLFVVLDGSDGVLIEEDVLPGPLPHSVGAVTAVVRGWSCRAVVFGQVTPKAHRGVRSTGLR